MPEQALASLGPEDSGGVCVRAKKTLYPLTTPFFFFIENPASPLLDAAG